MGTKYFHSSKKGGSGFAPSSLNLEARAGGAGGYASRAAGLGAQRNLSAAKVMSHYLKPGTKTAASAAPGPKKV